MAEQMKMLFSMTTPVGPKNIVLDRGPDFPAERGRRVWENFANSETTTYPMNS